MRSSRVRLRRLCPLVVLTAALALLPASASAAFHLTKVSEVFPAPSLPETAYIELQAFQAGQNIIAGHEVTVYDTSGVLAYTFTFPTNVPNAQTQRTVLLSGGSPPNGGSDDFTDPMLGTALDRTGGAACFDSIPVDCVAWGSITPAEAALLPGAVGTPAAPGGIQNGSSITRDISPGCATFLEAGDDTDISSTDFVVTTDKTPRPNTVAPTEVACGGGNDAPDTQIDQGPKKKTPKRSAKFRFSSPDAGASFECALDRKSFKPCSSPLKVKRVKIGKHTLSVRAVVGGTVDSSPATYRWKRKKG